MSSIYDGYHREWVPDEDWRLGTKYTKCRRPRCQKPPVAELDRMMRYPNAMKTRKQPYAYCADHMYGRKIENGQVLHWILVADGATTTQKEKDES